MTKKKKITKQKGENGEKLVRMNFFTAPSRKARIVKLAKSQGSTPSLLINANLTL